MTAVLVGPGGNIEIENEIGKPIPVTDMAQLVPSAYDTVQLTYTGSDVTQVVYRDGGAGGTIVATLVLSYSGPGVLAQIVRA